MVLSRPDAASIRRFGDTLLVEISDAVMIVPAALFHKMPERVRCAGSMETGSPVVAANQNLGRYIRSIARLVNVGGLTVGWIYLLDDYGPHADISIFISFQATHFRPSQPFNDKFPLDFG